MVFINDHKNKNTPLPKSQKGLVLFIAKLCALFLCLPSIAASDAVLIYHQGLKSEDLSTESLVRVYAMQKRVWSDGTPVKAYTLPSKDSAHKDFANHYLHMHPYQLERLWHRLVFSGTSSIPERTSSVTEMIDKVGGTPGAVGYIDKSLAYLIDGSEAVRVEYE